MTGLATPGGSRFRLTRAREGLAGLALAIAGTLLVISGWQLLAGYVANPTQVPSPLETIDAIKENWSSIPSVEYILFQSMGINDAVAYTVSNVLVGVAVGAALGVPIGVMLARLPVFRSIAEAPLLLLATTPILILLPFLTVWFGVSRVAQGLLVVVFTATTVMFAAQSAALAVGHAYSNFAASLGASQTRILTTVILPGAVPGIISAVRVGLALGWGLQAVAELLGGRAGVGRVIELTAHQQATTDLFAVVVVLLICALLVDALVAAVGNFLTRWRY